MLLITDEHRKKLRRNANTPNTDHVPVVKLFDPTGASTWLLTEIDEDDDIAFGLADLGFGCPELGSISVKELENTGGALGLGIERDLYFKGEYPLSVYAKAARAEGRIVEYGDTLKNLAA